jgi:hypothetical protein
MEKHANIKQHPHQESRRGYAIYASTTRMKSTPNESKEFQSFQKHTNLEKNPYSSHKIHRYFLPFRDDEDSDERTLYYGRKINSRSN